MVGDPRVPEGSIGVVDYTTGNSVWRLWNGVYIHSGTAGTGDMHIYASHDGNTWAQLNHDWWTDTSTATTAAWFRAGSDRAATTWQTWVNYAAGPKLIYPPNIHLPDAQPSPRVYQPDEAPAIIDNAALLAMREYEAEQQRKLQESMARAAEERKASEKRACELLMSVLSPQQQAQYQEKHYFELRCGKRTYRIHKGWARNITVLEGNREVDHLCIHPTIRVPQEDNLVAQKLALETDERAFLSTANHS